MADTEVRTNTEKWPLKCSCCGTKILPKKKYISIYDDLGISCGSERCTIETQEAIDNDGC